jgi:hypothetical protein
MTGIEKISHTLGLISLTRVKFVYTMRFNDKWQYGSWIPFQDFLEAGVKAF